jgi:acetyl esterase/lipase
MRLILSTLLGIVSSSMGLLIALPTLTYNNSIWVIQMLLGEFSWIPTLLGVTAVGVGVSGRKRSSWGIVLGAFGVIWSVVPFWQTREATRLNEMAMRRGLGEDYMRHIPPAQRARLRQRRWSLETSLISAGPLKNAYVVERDIVYHATPQRPLLLDVYCPQVPPARGDLYSAVIVVHGGAWRYGDKGEVFTAHNQYLASQGYVVFDIQYRLSDEAKHPAPLEDIRAAVRWVKHYSAAYRVDGEKVALLGRSAGGHLALLTAYRANEPGGEGTDVCAVVAIYPPTDLRMWYAPAESDIAHYLHGVPDEHPENYASTSVLEYARGGLPPTLLVQGYRDDLVLPSHSELLHNKLSATDTRVVTLRFPWSRHGFDAFLPGLASQSAQYDIDRFLAWAFYQ